MTPGRGTRLAPDIDFVFFDDGVGKQLFAHFLQRGAGFPGIALGKVKIDDFALADFADLLESQPVQRMPDGLALRIEHAILQGDENAGFHNLRRTAASFFLPRSRERWRAAPEGADPNPLSASLPPAQGRGCSAPSPQAGEENNASSASISVIAPARGLSLPPAPIRA